MVQGEGSKGGTQGCFIGHVDVSVVGLGRANKVRLAQRTAMMDEYTKQELALFNRADLQEADAIGDIDPSFLKQLLDDDTSKPTADGLVTYDPETIFAFKESFAAIAERPLLTPQTKFQRLKDPSVTYRFAMESAAHPALKTKLDEAHGRMSLTVTNIDAPNYTKKKGAAPALVLDYPIFSHHVSSQRVPDPSPGETAYYYHPHPGDRRYFMFHHHNSTYYDENCQPHRAIVYNNKL